MTKRVGNDSGISRHECPEKLGEINQPGQQQIFYIQMWSPQLGIEPLYRKKSPGNKRSINDDSPM
jgi:hypothetical protein